MRSWYCVVVSYRMSGYIGITLLWCLCKPTLSVNIISTPTKFPRRATFFEKDKIHLSFPFNFLPPLSHANVLPHQVFICHSITILTCIHWVPLYVSSMTIHLPLLSLTSFLGLAMSCRVLNFDVGSQCRRRLCGGGILLLASACLLLFLGHSESGTFNNPLAGTFLHWRQWLCLPNHLSTL
jgi:hypothetical protein